MRVFVPALLIAVLALGAVAGGMSHEPTEHQMRGAFEHSLLEQVRGALEFVAETSGEEAVTALREAGTDRFELRAFEKAQCQRTTDRPGHVCAFRVDIGLMNGTLQRNMTGWFVERPDGLAFVPEV